MNREPAPDDLHLMLLAWNSGSETQRAVALDLADRNREAAKPRTTPVNPQKKGEAA